MNRPQTTYIDCNRQYAEIQSENNKNEWVTKLQETIKLNAGSEISIQNSFINYKGLSGGSIELLEDYNIVMSVAMYLIHTEYMAIKSVYPNLSTIYDNQDPISNATTLKGIYYNNFEEVNYNKLMSPTLKTKMDTIVQVDGLVSVLDVEPYLNTVNGLNGYTEQPLFGVICDINGDMLPIINNVEVNIDKGIYGISQLGDIIQNQINSLDVKYNSNLNKDTKFNQYQVDYFNGEYNSTLKSQILNHYNIWNYKYEYLGVNYNTANDIIQNLPLVELTQLLSSSPIYITAEKYNELLDNLKQNIKSPSFNIKTFCNDNYWLVIKRRVNIEGIPTNTTGKRIYNEPTNPVTYGSLTEQQRVFDYNPYGNGYYLGSTGFLFNYNSEKSGYSIQYLHEPRRQPSHDSIGNKNTSEGQIVSFLKKFNMPDILTDAGLNTNDVKNVLNSIENPKSRISGIAVINWDITTAKKISGNNDITNNYYDWQDYFKSKSKAEEAWQNTLWFKLGFSYDQIQDRNCREKVKSYDLEQVLLPGFTTNNQIDTTITNTISGNYCPLQGVSNTDKLNTTLPYVIEDEVKQYSVDLPAKNYFQFNVNVYQDWKNVYYLNTQSYPILTQSNELIAKNLPDLSEQGYFLITSDIIDGYKDTVKSGDPLALLGVVPKSSLSNQDFISSFQEITQITTQDQILNSIKIKILNPDLTNPNLNSRSSVILKIVNNVPRTIKKDK